ncbi:MAG TPA: ELM1/GtrOC1 family putative glycosyltransferase, partial [Candidatus Omnitrophota bacterium]|nr:ELM1/GtrOC1 family putative glycosyltransferase [Candidatus Omnitrophota bacterium]
MKKKTLLEDALILNIVRAASFIVRRVPVDWSLSTARFIGAAVFYFSKRRFIAYKNLRSAFGESKSRSEIRDIARRSVENLSMSAVEMLRFPELDQEYIRQHIRIIGTDKFEANLREGRGLIFLTAHFGAWELLNVTAGMLGYPMVALARVQKHPRSDEYLNKLRTSKGGQVIRKGMPIREILRSLKKGKIVGMLSDQDGGRGGVFVKFFGRMSSSPPGVATFALRTNAPIYPVFNFREGWLAKPGQKRDWKKHRIEVEGPLEVPAGAADQSSAEENILQQFSNMLEEKIRTSPEQWLWAHRRWKSTPDRFVVVLSDGKTGHLNQSLAVYEAYLKERVARGIMPERTHLKVMEVRFKGVIHQKISQALCALFRGRVPFRAFWLRLFLQPQSWKSLERCYADVVISCGTSLAALNLFVKRENSARSVLIMKPPCPAARFDAVIVPRHDKIKKAENVFITRGALFAMDVASLKARGQNLLRELSVNGGAPKVGFLIGGGESETE